MTNHCYDILIIGAGPVGLATAIGLYKRGIHNLLVIDQTRRFRQVGRQVDILPNGLKAINAISQQAYQRLTSSNSNIANTSSQKNWSVRNLEGKLLYSRPLNFDSWKQKYGEGRITLGWYNLQTHLRELLPEQLIQINYRCVNLNQDNHRVNVECVVNQPKETNPFAHWERTTPNDTSEDDPIQPGIDETFQAKLVIAADGINSTVRQVLYHNSELEPWAKPQYSGYGLIGCLEINHAPSTLVKDLENTYFQGDPLVTVQPEISNPQTWNYSPPRLILYRKTDAFSLICHTPIELETIRNRSPQQLIQVAQEKLSATHFPESLIELMGFSHPDNLISRPYYLHTVNIPLEKERIWSSGRVVLTGDSAHGMPPFSAQGVNQGFEDALMIVKLIAELFQKNHFENQVKISEAFQQYENQRRPFLTIIERATMESFHWQEEEWEHYRQEVYNRDFMP